MKEIIDRLEESNIPEDVLVSAAEVISRYVSKAQLCARDYPDHFEVHESQNVVTIAETAGAHQGHLYNELSEVINDPSIDTIVDIAQDLVCESVIRALKGTKI
jgi:hypothetical protein